ncbi:MAG: 50S ribosomal protein L25 [Anaerolineae bacterium]
MNEYTITALPRDAKATPRALRRAGYTPCVMYGRESAPASIQVQTAQLSRLVNRAGSSMVTLSVEGVDNPYTALVREVQRDPVTRRLVHVDFLTVQANQVIRNAVPIVQKGTAPVVQRGGVIIQMLEHLEIECLPAYMPHSITIDISRLEAFNTHLTVADLAIPENVTVLTPQDAEVVHAMAPMREEVAEVAPAAAVTGEAAEGAEPAAETKAAGAKSEEK